ncbi:dihydrodiol dehydrogenase [Streptomyces radicis]|uniref:Dihydrodiol dehydrogenase n=1 Tax=Streptomyces radicis TaxID=1750517 RepID=A0A3A9VRA9_9ACTN|nr:dihydrodiol dehydrogenase [Streptomyces radicis]RKN13340.1 dihydrodiol dehydrogenase [Streptomyces radicis]
MANEFASVRLRLVDTPTGIRLEIYSLKLGERIHLDPVALESLTWQSPELFSTFLQNPLGPEQH